MQEFCWPRGTQAELSVYPEGHPQRIPTELYFAKQVRSDIRGVRTADPNHLPNLWLLIESLKELKNNNAGAGFHTWLWAIGSVLGSKSCREIGERVCREESFTIQEGLFLKKQNPTRGKELTAYPIRGRWYSMKTTPKSVEAKRLIGQLISVVEVDESDGTAAVLPIDAFLSRGAVPIRIPLTDMTYRRCE